MSRLLMRSDVYHAKATPENMYIHGDNIAAAISKTCCVPYEAVRVMVSTAWECYTEFIENHAGLGIQLEDELQGIIKMVAFKLIEEEYPGRAPETIEVIA